MERSATVTVVVPNFNGAHLLPACLHGLLAQSRPPDSIVVVDDASFDDSREQLAREFPQVRVVALPENRGFPGAVNAGIAVCTTDFVALLNNDAIADRDWLGVLLEAAARHPEYDAFACKMVKAASLDAMEPQPPRIDSAGLALARGFAQISIGDGETDGPPFDTDREVLGACGGAALYRRSYLDDLHGFDERFVAYFEDYDLALRGLLRGKRTLYVGAAQVRHLGSATLGRHSARGTRLYARNSCFVIGTAIPFTLYLRECFHVEWARLRMLALAATRGRFVSCLLGLIEGKWLLLRMLLRRIGRPLEAAPDATNRLGEFLRVGERLRRESRRAGGTRSVS